MMHSYRFAVAPCTTGQLGEVLSLLRLSSLCFAPIDHVEAYEARLQHDTESILVVTDGQVIGVVFFIYDPWVSTIHNLAVHPDRRRQGVGSALLEAAERIVTARGTAALHAVVTQTNSPSVETFRARSFIIAPLSVCEPYKLFARGTTTHS